MNIINEFFVSFILIKLYFKFKVCRKIKFPLLWKFYFSKWKFYFSADKSLNQEQKISYAREQAHIALASILYSANALNIASCTIGGFDKEKLDSYLSLDIQKERSSLVVALGYCNDKKNPQKNRFSFDEVVKFI